MRTINEAIQLLRPFSVKKEEVKFFSLKKSMGEVNKIINLLNDLESYKYVPEDPKNNERDLIVKQLQKKLTEIIKKNKGSEELIKVINQVSDIIKENLEYYSPGKQYCYWRGLEIPVASEPPGIAILCNDSRSIQNRESGPFPLDFKEKSINSLNYIAQTKSGKIILELIFQQLKLNPDMKIEIWPTTLQQGNRAIPHDSAKSVEKVADELSTGRPGENTLRALEMASGFEDDKKYEWFANAINEMPLITLEGKPGNNNFLKTPLTPQNIKEWFETGYDYLFKNHDKKAIAQILCAAIAILHPYAQPNLGSGTTVRWNTFSEHLRNQDRPPAIGLAHELIHALYNALGLQPGKEQDDTTAVFEYLAVGLGPWENDDLTENAIREQWVNIIAYILEDDLQNRNIPNRRTQYSTEQKEQIQPETTQKKSL